MRVPRTLLGLSVGRGARAQRRRPAGRHPQPAGRPRHPRHQRRRGGLRGRRDHALRHAAAGGVHLARVPRRGLRHGASCTASPRWAGRARRRSSSRSPGAAITAGLTSVTSAIVLVNVDALNELRIWQVGSLAGRYMPTSSGRRRRSSPSAWWRRAVRRPGAQRPGPRRGRRPRARPAGRLDAGRCCSSSWPCCAARRPRPAGRSCSSASSCRTWRGSSAGPTTAGSCPTRSCSPRSCCCSRTSSAASCSRPASCRSASCSASLGAPVFIALVRYRNLAEL